MSVWLPVADAAAAMDAEDFLVVVTVAAIAGTGLRFSGDAETRPSGGVAEGTAAVPVGSPG